MKVGKSCSSPGSDDCIFTDAKQSRFSTGKRDPSGAPLGAALQLFTGLCCTGNIFPDERTGRYRRSIISVPLWAFSAGLSIFRDCSPLGQPCAQDAGAEVWAKPQAVKTGIVYCTYRICEQPIQGPRHTRLCHPM